MRYKAVIFDLFGTLVDEPPDTFAPLRDALASLLKMPPSAFVWAWDETRPANRTGGFATTEAHLEAICGLVSAMAAPEIVSKAARHYRNVRQQALTPRVDAIATLQSIKRRGLHLGMISNCGTVERELWPECALAPHFDVVLLSAAVGLAKPDPRIYAIACERLGVSPGDCLYVGDGGSGELTGALEAGLHPVLIQAPYEPPDRYDDRPDARAWAGPRVGALSEVLTMIG